MCRFTHTRSLTRTFTPYGLPVPHRRTYHALAAALACGTPTHYRTHFLARRRTPSRPTSFIYTRTLHTHTHLHTRWVCLHRTTRCTNTGRCRIHLCDTFSSHAPRTLVSDCLYAVPCRTYHLPVYSGPLVCSAFCHVFLHAAFTTPFTRIRFWFTPHTRTRNGYATLSGYGSRFAHTGGTTCCLPHAPHHVTTHTYTPRTRYAHSPLWFMVSSGSFG